MGAVERLAAENGFLKGDNVRLKELLAEALARTKAFEFCLKTSSKELEHSEKTSSTTIARLESEVEALKEANAKLWLDNIKLRSSGIEDMIDLGGLGMFFPSFASRSWNLRTRFQASTRR